MKRPEAQLLARRIESIWSPDRQWTHTRSDEWVNALERCDEPSAAAAIDRLRNTHEKCPSMAELLQIARPSHTIREGHSIQCLCGGSGWIEVRETNERGGSWNAWARCPKGPHTSFVEPEDEYDESAGAAAHETYRTLVAAAKTREDVAEACFAAANAYRNAIRRPRGEPA